MTKTIAKNTRKAATKKSKTVKAATSKKAAAKTTAKKRVVKKAAPKKAAVRKPAAKKAAPKKAAVRKPAAKKAAPKKASVRKAPAKKVVARKPRLTARGAALLELQQIKGIGAKYAEVLYRNGIKSQQDVAKMLKADIERLSAKLKVGSRIRRENWVGQAKKLVRASKKRK